MVRHIILWKIKEELKGEAKAEAMKKAKNALEGLQGKVPGLVSIAVHINGLKTSNADMMLESVLESEEALAGYAVHPDHLYAANTFVRPITSERVCLDFEV